MRPEPTKIPSCLFGIESSSKQNKDAIRHSAALSIISESELSFSAYIFNSGIFFISSSLTTSPTQPHLVFAEHSFSRRAGGHPWIHHYVLFRRFLEKERSQVLQLRGIWLLPQRVRKSVGHFRRGLLRPETYRHHGCVSEGRTYIMVTRCRIQNNY